MESDSQLVAKILTRDRRAFDRVYRLYKDKLSFYIKSKIDDPSDAEEILQDTFFGFLESLRDFEGKCSLKTLLFAICNHKVVDYYRRKKLRQVVFSKIPEIESIFATGNLPEETYEARAIASKISQAFNTIIPKYKNILIAKYIERQSVLEIAHQLSMTAKSVECRLFRARKAFVKAYISI